MGEVKKVETKKTDGAKIEAKKAEAKKAEAPKAPAAKKINKDAKKVKITLVKSTAGCLEKQIRTVEALGLKKIRQSVVREDSDALRGMIFVVKHLVEVAEV